MIDCVCVCVCVHVQGDEGNEWLLTWMVRVRSVELGMAVEEILTLAPEASCRALITDPPAKT